MGRPLKKQLKHQLKPPPKQLMTELKRLQLLQQLLLQQLLPQQQLLQPPKPRQQLLYLVTANVHLLTRTISLPNNAINMATVSIVPIRAAVELKQTGLNGLIAVSHVVVVLELVPSASLGMMELKTVTMKVKTVTKMIALPGLHGNHGVVVLLNVKKVVAMIQQEHDTDVGIQKMDLANNVLVANKILDQENNVVEMPVMSAIKNRQRAVTKISNVLLNVNGLNGVNGAVVLLHVKTVSESEDEQITRMMVPLVTVPAPSQNDVLLLKLKSVLNA